MASAIDNLRHGADVYSSDGKKVGELHAIILEPGDNQVTHIAVNAGPFAPAMGFGDPRIVSVEMGRVRDGAEERIELDVTEAQFADFPLYEHTHFFDVPAEERAAEDGGRGPGRLWNTGLAIAQALASLGTGIGVPAEHVQKASFERHILNDAPVWRVEPNTHLGYVERVLVDEETDHIQSLVVKSGLIFQHDKTLPMRFVTEIRDGLVHAQLTDDEIDSLEDFEAE